MSPLDRVDVARDAGRLPDAENSARSTLLSLAATTKDNLPPARDVKKAMASQAKACMLEVTCRCGGAAPRHGRRATARAPQEQHRTGGIRGNSCAIVNLMKAQVTLTSL
jgi:hypothetical protein